MKVLVTGASGFIGKNFLNAFSNCDTTGLCFSHKRNGLVPVDLRDSKAVEQLLNEMRPDVVIHCAARPTVDWCESNHNDAHALNVAPTITLANICKDRGATLVFLSSDYVFDGKAGPYHENDTVNPINVYGRLKLEAEEEIARRLTDHLIIRTTNIYGFDRDSKNFLMPLLPRLARGEEVKVAADQFGNPTLVEDFCEAVRDLVVANARGVFHLVGPDWMNRVEWLRRAAQSWGLDPDLVVGIETDDLNQPAPRPRKSGLYSVRLNGIIQRPMVGLEEGLRRMRATSGNEIPVAAW